MEPAAKKARIFIKVCFKTPDGYEDVYETTPSSKLKGLLALYCENEGLPLDFVRFMFKKTRIDEQLTPEMLGMSPENNVISIKYNYSLPVIPMLNKDILPDDIKHLQTFATNPIDNDEIALESDIKDPLYVRCAHGRVTINYSDSSVCIRDCDPESPFDYHETIYEFWFHKRQLRCRKKSAYCKTSTVPIIDAEKHVFWNKLRDVDSDYVHLSPHYHVKIHQEAAIKQITAMMLRDEEGAHGYPYKSRGQLKKAPMWYVPSAVIRRICYAFGVKHKAFSFVNCKTNRLLKDHAEEIVSCLNSRVYDVVTATFLRSTGQGHIGTFFYQEPGRWVSVGIWQSDLGPEMLDQKLKFPYTRLSWKSVPMPDELSFCSGCQSTAYAALLHWLKFRYVKAFKGPRYGMWRVEYWQAIGEALHVRIPKSVGDTSLEVLIPKVREWLYRGIGDGSLPKEIEFNTSGHIAVARTRSVARERPPSYTECGIQAAFVDLAAACGGGTVHKSTKDARHGSNLGSMCLRIVQ